jgi:hypothetical protein
VNARRAAPEVSRTSGHGNIDRGSEPSLPRRPPELRALNSHPIEQKISALVFEMLRERDWNKRAIIWAEIACLWLPRRPLDMRVQMEVARMRRAMR